MYIINSKHCIFFYIVSFIPIILVNMKAKLTLCTFKIHIHILAWFVGAH